MLNKKNIIIGCIILAIIIGLIIFMSMRSSRKLTELSLHTADMADGMIGATYTPEGDTIIRYKVGSQIPINITYTPANAWGKRVNYISSDTNIIEISNKGIVTAKAAGIAEIHVISRSNNEIKSNVIKIQVMN